ncbi:MAG: twin-arginine translocation signal domain-containing protein [Rhodothermus sp.]|nr:twin-arginine translocation signal domain-containing protein [Rhodothermus sp.]
MTRRDFLQLAGLGLAAWSIGCQPPPSVSRHKHWAWMGANVGRDDEARRTFARLKASGIEALLLHENREEGPAFYERLAPLARAEGLELHAWIPTMMRPELLETHPDWYAVNREGVSTAEKPPYVDYYRFLSPCVPDVRAYLANYYDRMAQVDGLAGLHLDYIRFPDVILPITLQPKYGLVQDREYPAFDYGYHPACRDQFKAQTGIDPLELEDPPTNAAWQQFRYDQITAVVHQIAERVQARGKLLTAAVFPTPEIARTLVRQDWRHWPLDAVMPMIYHNFYDRPVTWIETATREGVAALHGRIPLYSGLFVPALSPDELDQAITYALAGGASGISLFNVESLTDGHWNVLKARLAG